MSDKLSVRVRDDFLRLWRPTLGFHFLMQALGFAIFGPLATRVARRLVAASGEPVITNFDIASYLLSPIGVLFLVVVAAMANGLLLAEFAGLSFISGHAIARRPVTVLAAVALVLKRLPALFGLGARVFLRLLLLALPFLAVVGVLWFSTLRGHDINYYLAEHPPEWRRATIVAAALGLGYAILATWQLARWIYAVPQLVFQSSMPEKAIAESVRMTRGKVWPIVRGLAAWWLLMIAIALAAAWLGRQASDLGLDWAGIDFRRVLPLVALFVGVAALFGIVHSAVLLGGHQFLVTRMFAEERDAARWRDAPPLEDEDPATRRLAKPAVIVTLVLLAIAMVLGWIMAARVVPETQVAITAHRGASIRAPENSMAAFRTALEAGADYVELDVQRSRDGGIIVVHDGDLMRMAGDPRKVDAIDLAEFAGIDIGRRFDAAFAGETPPTLEAVIDLVRGRMKINIELKYNVPDPELAPAVVDLLWREDFVDQVVITSLDAAALQQIKGIEPALKVGLIVTAAVGDVVRTPADFVSLNSAQATSGLIRRAHRAGKEVHVWTVNKPDVMLRMIERGVDNIITDDPALLARVIRERDALGRGEQLALRLRILFDKPPRELVDPAAVQVL